MNLMVGDGLQRRSERLQPVVEGSTNRFQSALGGVSRIPHFPRMQRFALKWILGFRSEVRALPLTLFAPMPLKLLMLPISDPWIPVKTRMAAAYRCPPQRHNCGSQQSGRRMAGG